MPKNKQKSKQKSRRKGLKKKCWNLMSLYVRLKHSDKYGFVTCVTCGKVSHYKKFQCGHFWHGVLDYDEDNLRPQCVACNHFKSGNLAEYSMYLLKTKGLKFLKTLWEKKNLAKLGDKKTLEELEQIAIDLTLKISELMDK